jgi:hypothetical protein
MKSQDYSSLSVKNLLIQFADTIDELKQRGVVRTRNNPVADYSEWLTINALGLTLERNSKSGFDAKNNSGIRFQIKGRRLDETNTSRQLSVIRNLDKMEFDFLVGMIFDHDFKVQEAYKIPHQLIKKYARFSEHQNGYILQLRGDITKEPNVVDITPILKALQE